MDPSSRAHAITTRCANKVARCMSDVSSVAGLLMSEKDAVEQQNLQVTCVDRTR